MMSCLISISFSFFPTILHHTAGVSANKAPPDVKRLLSDRLLKPSSALVWLLYPCGYKSELRCFCSEESLLLSVVCCLQRILEQIRIVVGSKIGRFQVWV